MESIILYVTAALCLLIAVLLIAVLTKISGLGGSGDGDRQTADAIKELNEKTVGGFSSIEALSKTQNENMNNRMEGFSKTAAELNGNLVKQIADIREDLSQAARRQTETLHDAVEKLQQSNEKKLEEMRKTVDEKLSATLTERLDSSFKSVSEQLSNVYTSLGEMKTLSDDIGSLNRMFTGVKLRGTWAEAQLEGILEKIIPGMFVKNYSPDGVGGVVEFAVKIPDTDGNIAYLPIDSKFPAEDYIRLSEAAEKGDAEGVKNARAALAKRVLSEARDIKKYITPPSTVPFAVMYLATDALYAEVVSLPENLPDRIHDECSVMLAGPSTITALLSSLAMGFKTVALNKKAAEVMDILAAAKKQYETFADALDKVGKKMGEANKALDDARKRNDIINKKLRSVEEIDRAEAEEILLAP